MIKQVSALTAPIASLFSKDNTDAVIEMEGIRIGRVVKKAFQFLAVFFTSTALVSFFAATLTGASPAIRAALTVSSKALWILFSLVLIEGAGSCLPEKVGRPAHLLRASAVDFFAILLLTFMFPIKQSWFDRKVEGQYQIPILLVHGYMHNSSAWGYHCYQYRKAGFANVYTLDLGHPFQGIKDHVNVVREKVQKIRDETGCGSFFLVGHSMGGCVAADYALTWAEADGIEVKGLHTLGSPLEGTYAAYFGVGRCAQQLRVGSAFISDLSRRLHESAIPVFHQASKADLIVMPYRSALNGRGEDDDGEGDRDVVLYEDLGHASYLFSDRVVWENIKRFRRGQERGQNLA